MENPESHCYPKFKRCINQTLVLEYGAQFEYTFHKEGEDPTALSEYLNIDITPTQKKVVGPKAFDVSVRRMLQDSCLSRGHQSGKSKR